MLSSTIEEEEEEYLERSKKAYNYEDISDLKRNCIIGIPRYHDNLFQVIRDNQEWLQETKSQTPKFTSHRKQVRTKEDLDRINKIITDLRTVKSELFIDFTFHRKPKYISIGNYITEFLRIKGIFSYYTFRTWYRVTIHPESGDEEAMADNIKREILLVPLYIRLKNNKTYDQLKSIHYLNDSGTEYEARPVNPKHFLRDDDSSIHEDIQDVKNEKNYNNVNNPKYVVNFNEFEQEE